MRITQRTVARPSSIPVPTPRTRSRVRPLREPGGLAKRAGDGTPRDDRPREDRPREDRFRDDRRFTNVRQIGTIAALDIATSDPGYLAGIGPRLYNDFLARGLLVRPLGNTIYLMPPYCSTTDEIDLVFDAIGEIADGMG